MREWLCGYIVALKHAMGDPLANAYTTVLLHAMGVALFVWVLECCVTFVMGLNPKGRLHLFSTLIQVVWVTPLFCRCDFVFVLFVHMNEI